MIRAAALALSVLMILGPAQIHEESPHWSCSTMGNRVCGPSR